MNLPNKLTVGRLILTIFFVASLSLAFPFHYTLALFLFALASATDYLDGMLARKHGWITDFGKLMDPLADKILTAAAFVCLIPMKAIPAWVVIIVIAREFLITGLRLLASAKGVVLPAEKLGKHKTAWQIATILFFLLLLSLREWTSEHFAWHAPVWTYGGGFLILVMTVLTVYSGSRYFWNHRSLIATN